MSEVGNAVGVDRLPDTEVVLGPDGVEQREDLVAVDQRVDVRRRLGGVVRVVLAHELDLVLLARDRHAAQRVDVREVRRLTLQDRVERGVRARQRQARPDLDRVAGDALGQRRRIALRRVEDRGGRPGSDPPRVVLFVVGRGIVPATSARSRDERERGAERHRRSGRSLRERGSRRTSVMASVLSWRTGRA